MATFLLIRHASHSLLGEKIAGRMPGVHLSPAGREEARLLAARLPYPHLQACYSSPMERALETAAPTAKAHNLQVEVRGALNELDFGDWTGCTLKQLEREMEWRAFNLARSITRIPGGETMGEAQERIVNELHNLYMQHQDGTVAVVSHGDVIKAALMYWLEIPLDLFFRFEISPASVSVLDMGADWVRVVSINERYLVAW